MGLVQFQNGWWALKSPRRKVLTSKLRRVFKSALMSVALSPFGLYTEKKVKGGVPGKIILIPMKYTIYDKTKYFYTKIKLII